MNKKCIVCNSTKLLSVTAELRIFNYLNPAAQTYYLQCWSIDMLFWGGYEGDLIAGATNTPIDKNLYFILKIKSLNQRFIYFCENCFNKITKGRWLGVRTHAGCVYSGTFYSKLEKEEDYKHGWWNIPTVINEKYETKGNIQ